MFSNNFDISFQTATSHQKLSTSDIIPLDDEKDLYEALNNILDPNMNKKAIKSKNYQDFLPDNSDNDENVDPNVKSKLMFSHKKLKSKELNDKQHSNEEEIGIKHNNNMKENQIFHPSNGQSHSPLRRILDIKPDFSSFNNILHENKVQRIEPSELPTIQNTTYQNEVQCKEPHNVIANIDNNMVIQHQTKNEAFDENKENFKFNQFFAFDENETPEIMKSKEENSINKSLMSNINEILSLINKDDSNMSYNFVNSSMISEQSQEKPEITQNIDGKTFSGNIKFFFNNIHYISLFY